MNGARRPQACPHRSALTVNPDHDLRALLDGCELRSHGRRRSQSRSQWKQQPVVIQRQAQRDRFKLRRRRPLLPEGGHQPVRSPVQALERPALPAADLQRSVGAHQCRAEVGARDQRIVESNQQRIAPHVRAPRAQSVGRQPNRSERLWFVKQHGVDEEHSVAGTVLWQRCERIYRPQRRDVRVAVVEILWSVGSAHADLPPAAALQVGPNLCLIGDPGDPNPPIAFELRTVHVLWRVRAVVPNQAVGRPHRRRQRIGQSRQRRPLLANPLQRLLQRLAREGVRPGRTGGPHDTDHISAGVEHRPSTGAAANRAAGLDVVVPDLDYDSAARKRQRLSAGIPHHEHRLANIIRGRRSQPHHRNIRHQLRIHYLQQRQIKLRVSPQHDRADRPLAMDQRRKRGLPFNHVMRGDKPAAADMKRRSE